MPKSVHTAAYKTLCDKLVAARHKLGVTQAELARTIQRPQSFVAKYERGERRLDVIELLEICAALATDAEKLVRSLKAKL